MTPEQAFLQAIKREPNDDSLRLIFADWLADHDQPERAELIRLQVQLARFPQPEPRQRELRQRERGLLKRHEDEWLGALRLLGRCELRRGLVFLELALDGAKGPVPVVGEQELAWLEGVRAFGLQKDVGRLLDHPVLPYVTHLDLDARRLGRRAPGHWRRPRTWPASPRST